MDASARLCYTAVVMISRYTPDDFAQLWSPMRRYRAWLDVELAACEAMEKHGLVPAGTAETVRKVTPLLEPSAIEKIEQVTRHDVIAFLTHVEELAGAPARWLHMGMTSSDVLDTALALLLREASDRILTRFEGVLAAFEEKIAAHRRTPMMGRTHGMFAEPVTFGLVLAGHYAELKRAQRRVQQAREEISVGKIAGAVGTYGHLTPQIELDALEILHLRAETVATQVVCRDRHAGFVSALALAAAALERFATNMRHWQRTELAEAEEPFTHGQKGSSAMPHKRNPILSENLCGLARVVRAALTPALENTALWHERDISHSSVERMVLPDATTTIAHMLDRTKYLVQNMQVYPANMKRQLDEANGLWASEGVLLELVQQGMPRKDAYVLVQRNAMKAIAGEGSFQALLTQDTDIVSRVGAQAIAEQFNLDRALAHVDTIVDRALGS